MAQRHKVFVSYYHKEDQEYEELFDSLFALRSSIIVSKSVDMGDIDLDLRTETTYQKIRDEYISDATVTVVLNRPTHMATQICGLGDILQSTAY